GPGTETIAYAQAFPDAEIWGVDLSAPFLRFAHVWAEDLGTPIHYRQVDARDTGFEAGSFDLIVSNIMFHETGDDILPDILKEMRRLIAPKGVMLHVDVPFQVHRTPVTKQVTNHWQVINNGEPYWSGFANLDVGAQLERAGFDAEHRFTDYDPLGDGHMLVFGARGPM
ncbi:MAG: class I SAM-dependent methyltransferase, partial [Pseudomonadota bacterium]